MNKQDKLIFGIVIAWCLTAPFAMFMLGDNESRGDSKINGYPQEFYDTTK